MRTGLLIVVGLLLAGCAGLKQQWVCQSSITYETQLEVEK